MEELLRAVISLGPPGIIAAISLYFWREERAERRECHNQLTQLIRDKIISDNELANGLERLSDKLGGK